MSLMRTGKKCEEKRESLCGQNFNFMTDQTETSSLKELNLGHHEF